MRIMHNKPLAAPENAHTKSTIRTKVLSTDELAFLNKFSTRRQKARRSNFPQANKERSACEKRSCDKDADFGRFVALELQFILRRGLVRLPCRSSQVVTMAELLRAVSALQRPFTHWYMDGLLTLTLHLRANYYLTLRCT
jgi:hypothetical protein